MATNYYFFGSCPCPDQCSDAAWKRSKVWGWTEEEARQRLRQHLQHSGLHQQDSSEAKMWSESAEVTVQEWATEEKQQHVQNQQQQKRRKTGEPMPAGDVQSIVQETVRAIVPDMMVRMPKACPPSGRSEKIQVRKELLQLAVDALGRAQTAARQAKRLSEAAAAAFGDEADILGDCKHKLEDILHESS